MQFHLKLKNWFNLNFDPIQRFIYIIWYFETKFNVHSITCNEIIESILYLFVKLYFIQAKEIPSQNYKKVYYLNENWFLQVTSFFTINIYILFQIKLAASSKKGLFYGTIPHFDFSRELFYCHSIKIENYQNQEDLF